MPPAKVKRFYISATAVEAEGGFHVVLDGKPVRTPLGKAMLVKNRALAEALAAEWDSQKSDIDMSRMGLHQLAASALDRGKSEQAALADELAAYGATDLLCYRADEPQALAVRQAAAWDPLLDWAAARCGARLNVTSGVIAVAQDAAALSALTERISRLDSLQLSALRAAVGIGGSLIVGLALAEGRLDAAQAWAIVNVDEDWQREKWGEDAQAAVNRADAYTAFCHAVEMLGLLQVLESDAF
ncbi:MAG: ATPase [Alphaproteobacteria bacterium]|nr:ATPase [Alphaproteobacteria bacterium]